MKYHKDGIARDLAKLKSEFQTKWKPCMAVALDEFWGAFPNPIKMFHKFTNLWVEACRSSPYFMGHILVMLFWIGVGLMAYPHVMAFV